MFLEGEPSSENPVTAEDIVGIPKDDIKPYTGEKAKSSDLKVPQEIQDEYERRREVHGKEYDKTHLFGVSVGSRFEQPAHELTQRSFSRYRYVTNKFMENALEFSTSNQLQLEKNGNFLVRKGDVYPLGSRGIESDFPVSLAKEEGKLAFGTPLNNARVLEVRFDKEGALSDVLLWPTTGGVESSLTREIEPEEDQEEPSKISWGEMEYEDSEWSGYFRRSYTELALRYNQDGDLTWNWDHYGDGSEFKTLADELGEIEVSGQRAHVIDTSDQLKLIFYKKDNPDTVELELTIPKHQEIISFETGTETEQRFAFEEDLIPENIRKNPQQSYSSSDEIWRSANLTQLLGIQVEQRVIL